MKKLISCFALAALAACMCILPACQAEKTTDDKFFVYTLAEGGEGYLVSASGLELPAAVFIPAEHEGLPVLGIAEGGFKGAGCTTLLDVVFRGKNVEIGDYAFDGLANLRSVELRGEAQSLKIGDYAFNSCGKLKELTFSNELQSVEIGSYAFANTGFESFALTAGSVALGDYSLAGTAIKTLKVGNLVSFGRRAVYGCDSLASIEVSGSAYKTEGGNLYGADGTLVLYAPASPAKEFTADCNIGAEAFYGAKNLKKLTLTANVQTVGDFAFAESAIEELIYFCPASVLAGGALNGCGVVQPTPGSAN